MRILYYNEGEDPNEWLPRLCEALPEADIRHWEKEDHAPADYALVWKPPHEMLAGRNDLKAIFNLAAGVDALLAMKQHLPENVPVLRLEDAGMGVQMTEYVLHAVLRYFRRFDEYADMARHQEWKMLEPLNRARFQIGIMGLGVMGQRIAQALKFFHFPVRGWSRSRKTIAGIKCFSGTAELNAFLQDTQVLVCALPLTDETVGILNQKIFSQLNKSAYLINVGRGSQLVEDDLLAALESGQIKAATLDVAATEPLPPSHPFWKNKNITMTPHIAALTYCGDTVSQVVEKLRAFERGEKVTGIVDMKLGY